MATHYVFGAGRIGCLFDFGPEHVETMEGAIECARFYLEDLSEETTATALNALRDAGIYYFTRDESVAMAADYIQILKVEDGF